jgi:beta-barrel assembly-enhancing protease
MPATPSNSTPPSSVVYPAHAFHASLPNGRAAGELALTAEGFMFTSEAGPVTVPFDGANLTMGGAGNRLVFVAHPAMPEWSIYTSESSLLRDARILQHPGLLQSIDQIRGRKLRTLGVTLAVLVLLLGLPALLLLNLGGFTRVAARQVPADWEVQLGKLAFGQYEVRAKLVEDDAAEQLLEKLTAPLTAALPDKKYAFHFYIARESSLNAFALPGGYVVVHSELLLRSDSAEELLGVLAHEISHVTEQHGTRNLLASAGLMLTLQMLIGDAGGVFGTLASAAPFLLTQKYSRGFEREADRRGYELLVRADIDPKGMVSFFEKIKAEETKVREKMRKQGETGELMSEMPEFLSTHPATDSRIADLRQMVAAHNGAYRDLNDTFAALKARVQAAEASAPQQSNEEGADENTN